ncbi:MAG: hypothetical protein R3C59_15030 [Planctomycetaceae bacterium]
MKTQPTIPVLLIVAVLTVVVFALGGLILYDRSLPDAPDADVSEFEAERFHEVAQTQIPAEPPFADSERGVVVESTDDVIRLEGRVSERVWPIADDAEVWKQGERITATDIRAGETVSLQVQKLGSRQDGWIPTVIRINVDPVAGVSAADREIPDDVASGPEPDQPIAPQGLREVTFSGTVVDAGERTVTIRDRLGDELSYAIAETATVRRADEVGSADILQDGDRVRLVGRRVGDRSSGQTVLIDRITVMK